MYVTYAKNNAMYTAFVFDLIPGSRHTTMQNVSTDIMPQTIMNIFVESPSNVRMYVLDLASSPRM